jgi:ribosome maturation factor RimP
MQNLADILKLAELEAEPLGLTVVETRLCQQGRSRVLEVSIYRIGGSISLDDCEELSRRLDRALEEHQPPLIEGSYMLEVQSPGLERQLKTEREFRIFAGQPVEVKMKDALAALGDHFSGILQTLDGKLLTIANPEALRPNAARRKKNKQEAPAATPPAKVCLEWDRIASIRLR